MSKHIFGELRGNAAKIYSNSKRWRAYFPKITRGDMPVVLLRIETGTASLRRAFRDKMTNDPLTDLRYFDLASWYNNQDKVVMGNNVYTVGTGYGSAEEARNHLPPKKVWGDRTEDEWNNLVDWWSHPDRVARIGYEEANAISGVGAGVIRTKTDQDILGLSRSEYHLARNMSGKARSFRCIHAIVLLLPHRLISFNPSMDMMSKFSTNDEIIEDYRCGLHDHHDHDHSQCEEQPNERTPLPPPRKKSLSPPQAPSKSISSKSTYYTSSSSLSESPTPTYVAPPPKLCFVIPIK
ncbi:hypothetical protein Tco_1420840 [Tanacetum coccineum]